MIIIKQRSLNFLYAWLAVVALATPQLAFAGESVWPLIANGGTVASSVNVGQVIVNDNGTSITVTFNVDTGADLGSPNSSPTLLHFVAAEANCAVNEFPLSKGNPVPGQYDQSATFAVGVDTATLTLARPTCLSGPVLVSAHANVKELGGAAGFNYLFPSDVRFSVALDSGSDPNASYFDTTFQFDSGNLTGQTFDGWCIDVGHFITPNTIYNGTAYSIFNLPSGVGNIDHPEKLPAVMWLINNYGPGDIVDLTNDTTINPVTLTSGDIQRAIWLLVDDTPNFDAGAINDGYPNILAEIALKLGSAYNPGNLCGQLIPIILDLGSDIGSSQTTIAQTTLFELGVACSDVSATAMAMNTTKQVVEKGSTRYGEQFPGSNWFSYVILPQ